MIHHAEYLDYIFSLNFHLVSLVSHVWKLKTTPIFLNQLISHVAMAHQITVSPIRESRLRSRAESLTTSQRGPIPRQLHESSNTETSVQLASEAELVCDAQSLALIDRALCKAVVSSDVRCVRDLLREGHDPNSRDSAGNSALHIAALLGHAEIAKELIAAGGDVDACTCNESKSTPLLTAIESGHTEIGRMLLDHGADTRATNGIGVSPLLMAAFRNDVRMMLALINKGADVNHRFSVTGWSPLHAASACNNPVAIAILVHAGANVNARDNDGDTPLIAACSMEHIDCVHQLLAGGADPKLMSKVSGIRLKIGSKVKAG